jgi:hypothetical protein
MKKFLIFLSLSLCALVIGGVSFSIKKIKTWKAIFGMSYSEFSRAFGRAVDLLHQGVPTERIREATGIDFNHPEIKKYFPHDNPQEEELERNLFPPQSDYLDFLKEIHDADD